MARRDRPREASAEAPLPPNPAVPGTVCELAGGDLWTREEPDGTVTVGMTRKGQERVGPVVHYRGPEVGRLFRAGESLVSIESSKWVGHLAVPYSGEVVEANPAPSADPGIINRDPEGAGWLYRYHPARPTGREAPLDR